MPFVEESELPINVNLKNFEGIVNEVLEFGFNDGPQVNRRRVETWVNEGLFQIAREVEAPEFQETKIYETELGNNKYKLPENFLRVQSIHYPNLTTRLRQWDLQQFDFISNEVQGPPALYMLYQGFLFLFPTPNETGEELWFRYIFNPSGLVNATDIPRLNPNYWHLLVMYGVVRAFEAEDDHEAAQYFLGRYKENLDAYATDVQLRSVDRPRVIDGSWYGSSYGSRGVI